MKFVLIYWLIANSNLFAASGTQVFDDQSACTQALATITKSWPGSISTPAGVCVPQSSSDGTETQAPGVNVTVNNNTTIPAGPSHAAAPSKSSVPGH